MGKPISDVRSGKGLSCSVWVSSFGPILPGLNVSEVPTSPKGKQTRVKHMDTKKVLSLKAKTLFSSSMTDA